MILHGVNLTDMRLPDGFDRWSPDQQETFCKEVAKGLHEHRRIRGKGHGRYCPPSCSFDHSKGTRLG